MQAAAVFEQVDPAVIVQRWGLGAGTPVETVAVDPALRSRFTELRDRNA